MIFVLHYLLFNAGTPATVILLTLYLQTYSDASLSEIGALLMVLPFILIVMKPLFCALADRQRAHKQYLIGSLLLMAIGYGSLAIAPFFPTFLAEHGRLVWYLDILGVIVGFSAFGVIWSLGDALAVNAASIKNIPWSAYRVWGTVSWGVFGYIIGQINELPFLPKYVPAFFLLIATLLLEVVLVSLWPSYRFDMGAQGAAARQLESAPAAMGADLEMNEAHWPPAGSLAGTLNGSARLNPRLMGAMANILMEDIGGSIKSSLKLGQATKRTALADVLREHNFSGQVGQPIGASPQLEGKHSPALVSQSMAADGSFGAGDNSSSTLGRGVGATSTLGRAALRRTQHIFSRMNSLSSASGHAIADMLNEPPTEAGAFQQQQPLATTPTSNNGACARHQRPHLMTMSSLASQASLSRAVAARELGFGHGLSKELSLAGNLAPANGDSFGGQQQAAAQIGGAAIHCNSLADPNKSVEDLQLVLLKLIMKRDRNILKYLILFTLKGILFTIHTAYFFLYVESVCREKKFEFSAVVGTLLAAQSVSEIFAFLVIVPYYNPRVGRTAALMTALVMFIVRFTYYGTYYASFNPYSAAATEVCHGIAFGIVYSMITDIATEYVNQVDEYMPELVQRGIVHPKMDPNELKLPLRATMQGVFSGAFDGLGNGLGALFAGIYLDSHSFTSLWIICASMSLALAVIYPLTELPSVCGRSGSERGGGGGQTVKAKH